MTEIEITDPAEWREGDRATAVYGAGKPFEAHITGRLSSSISRDYLYLGGYIFRGPDGPDERWSDVRVTRTVPDLPTEPGATILVTECRGERVDPPVRLLCNDRTRWWSPVPIGGGWLHNSEHITSWQEDVR